VALALISFALALGACTLAFDWHLGDVGGWLSGLGSIGAALAALRIPTRDRQDRNEERQAESRAQAMLVLVDVGPPQGQGGYFP
jgi:hypothetical protein